jgi:NADPH2:quinone reductase
MRGVVTDSSAVGGLRLAGDLPEPRPAPHELVLAVRAFSINAGEVSLIEQRPDGWRPGQDTAGVVVAAAADGSGPPAGTRVVAYPEWEGWAERIPVPANWVAALPEGVSFGRPTWSRRRWPGRGWMEPDWGRSTWCWTRWVGTC